MFLSFIVSNGNYDVLEYRFPFLVVEISSGTIEGVESDGKLFGTDEHGYYRGFGKGNIGDTKTSVFVYNPFNNIMDDIIKRIDL